MARVAMLALFVSVGAAAGCGGGGGESAAVKRDTNGVADQAPGAALQGVSALLSDNNVLALLDTGYASLVQFDTLAVQRATDPNVKSYATAELSQHTQARRAVAALRDRLQITLALPDKRVLRDDRKTLSSLSTQSGAAFDKAYLDGVIDVQKDMEKETDEALGGKTAPEVKTFLQEAKANQQTALKQAQDLRSKMQ
jgi:putative membrane protein